MYETGSCAGCSERRLFLNTTKYTGKNGAVLCRATQRAGEENAALSCSLAEWSSLR